MAPSVKGTAPGRRKSGTWPRQVGLKPHTVTAYERADKGNTVWLRWTRPGQSAPGKLSLGFKLRDDSGRIDPARETEAVDAAKRAYNRLLKGEDPRMPEPEAAVADGPLTIEKGLEEALREADGMYAVENEHVRDMRRYKRHLLTVLAPGATWDDLTSLSYERVWRKLAHLKVAKGIGGRRSTELAIVLLAQTGRWLKRGGRLKQAPAEPEERYLKKLHADWQRVTGEPAAKARPPRHSPDEMGRLLLNLDNDAVDPRIRLALRTAGEARLGQALRCDRAMLDLSAIGAYGLGRFTIPDNVKKRGALIDLTPDMRAAWDFALTEGYLRDLEAAYRAGHRDNYPLFPGRRLVGGIARADVTKPIGDRGATDLWHEFERAAGVAVIAGRAWYGIRRVGADLAEDVQPDGRVLNELTGHTTDEMRRRIYQEQRRAKILKDATLTREAARQLAIDAAIQAAQTSEAAGVGAAPPAPSQWELSRDAKRARRRAAHAARNARAKPTFPPKPCGQCGTEFVPAGPNSRACQTCSPRRVRPPKLAAEAS